MSDSPQLLPHGWTRTGVGELFDIKGGGTPPTDNPAYWDGSIPWMTSADIHGLKDITPRKKITHCAIENSATNCVPKGSIIVVTRVGLGKIALASSDLCFSQDCQGLINNWNYLVPEYCLYYLSEAVQIFKYKNQGTTINGVTVKQLRELGFPLPPLPEQHRIVTKIEELFTQLDAGVASLKKVQAQLKRYRQAVLKAAFEGRLTQEWREEHKGEIEPVKILVEKIQQEQNIKGHLKIENGHDQFDSNESPQEWIFIQLKFLFKWSNGEGLSKNQMIKGDFTVYGGNGVTGTHNGWISEKEAIVIGRVGAHCGNVNLTKPKSWITDNAIFSSWFSKYIYLKFYLYALKNLKLNQLSGGSGQPYISQSILNRLYTCLPPYLEQIEIANEIERHFSQIDYLEKIIISTLRQAETLRQSILKQAFEGKLVPQDPKDEPASILLERIKAEKTKTIPISKKGKLSNQVNPRNKL